MNLTLSLSSQFSTGKKKKFRNFIEINLESFFRELIGIFPRTMKKKKKKIKLDMRYLDKNLLTLTLLLDVQERLTSVKGLKDF